MKPPPKRERCHAENPKTGQLCILDKDHSKAHYAGTGFHWTSSAENQASRKPTAKELKAIKKAAPVGKVSGRCDAAMAGIKCQLTRRHPGDHAGEGGTWSRDRKSGHFDCKPGPDTDARPDASRCFCGGENGKSKPHELGAPKVCRIPDHEMCVCVHGKERTHMLGAPGCTSTSIAPTEAALVAALEAESQAPRAIIIKEEQPAMLSVERAREFLAKSRSVDEVREVADKAKAVALYLRSRDASIESQNDAAEIRLRAERRLGELTAEMPKAKGAIGTPGPGRGKRGPDERPRLAQAPTLAEQGIKKQDAAKWQQLAKIPEKRFEKVIADTRAKGERLTANAPLKLVRQETKAKMAEELRSKPIPQVTGRFDVIVIDPPWMYEKRAEDITQRGQIDYPPMELDAIKALPIAKRAEKNCILWCWTTNAFIRDAFECLDAWGFTQKTILTWGKNQMGNGDWLRGKTEHCLLATRGSPIVTLTNQTTLLIAPVREHSRKPDEFYELVEALCPGTRLDMFAREARAGWVLWGAETDRFAGAA